MISQKQLTDLERERAEKCVQRESGLELFRILTMMLIIAHHYVVNSGLIDVIFADPLNTKSIFLLLFGAWGKTGINCFLLITSYFMCKSEITMKKFLKLIIQVEFYKIIFFAIFTISGYTAFNYKNLFKAVVPIWNMQQNFTSCFLIFFLCIPFLNILVRNMTEKQHRNLLALVGLFYIFLGSIPKFHISFNYVTWFCIIYFIGSYLRLYPIQLFENKKARIALFIGSVLISTISILIFHYIGFKYDKHLWDFWLADSNKILAVVTSVNAFVFFKYLKIPYNKFINTVASTTFGVLLIHANSDTMRQWLWKDFLNNVGNFQHNGNIYLHAILSVIGIFVVCSILDYLRIKVFAITIEKKL